MEHLYAKTIEHDSCNLWQGAVNSAGYATRRFNRKNEYVHRLTYARERGTVPRLLRNLCGHKHCINPYHWEALQNLRQYNTDTRTWFDVAV